MVTKWSPLPIKEGGTDGTTPKSARRALGISEGVSSDNFVSVKDFPFGAVGDGVTDDTAAIQAAATTGKSIFFPTGTYLISSAVTLSSNADYYGAGASSIIQTATININMFAATSKTGIRIYGLHFKQTAGGLNSYVGAVSLTTCTHCNVTECEIEGAQWAGVYLNNSSFCLVRSNYFHDFIGTNQDAADVCIYTLAGPSNDNIVIFNKCFGGGAHGILCQDPYTTNAQTPNRNLIQGNEVGQHTTYGILIYVPAEQCAFTGSIAVAVLTVTAVASGALAVGQSIQAATTGVFYGTILSFGTGAGGTGTYNLDTSNTIASSSMQAASTASTNNKVLGNDIHDIQGSFSTNRSSGAGIYVVGAGAGGTIIEGNNIRNCCVQTLDRVLTPAGIGIHVISGGVAIKPLVANNVISGMTQGDGILVATSAGGASLTENVITMPATNNGTGPGGGGLAGSGIRIEASSSVSITGHDIGCLGSGNAVQIYANGAICADITVIGGTCTSVTGPTFQALQNGGFTVNNLTLSSLRLKMTTNNNYALSLNNVSGCDLSNVNATSGTFEALHISAASQLRISGGSYIATGGTNITTAGTCTGGFLDKTAYWGTSATAMTNAGTGFRIEWQSSAVPGTGTWAVGDRTEQSVPVVGNPKGWRCTVAGAPGTWVSEGNL